jgi:putative two-component system response regulator
MAEALELPAPEVELIRRAALLHDLAAVGRNPSPTGGRADPGARVSLADQVSSEWLLEGGTLPVLRTAREMLSGLAEHWDGSGTPRGLRGGAIPLSARIVAAADHFDTLTQAGPGAETGETTGAGPIEELERLAGHRFDPSVVQALIRTETARVV